MSDGKLKALDVSRAMIPGKYPDGAGLYLQVLGADSKSWLYRYWFEGKERWMGLGSFKDLSLSQARTARDIARGKVKSGVDLVGEKKAERDQIKIRSQPLLTFRQAAETYLRENDGNWKNAKHRDQWRSTLQTYAYPVIGEVATSALRPSDILAILEPIWNAKRVTAARLRGRIETILASVVDVDAVDYRNPATMTLQLRNRLPKDERRKRKSHPALPFGEMTVFTASLASSEGVAAQALKFLILTVGRTSEVLEAQWSEFDFGNNVWTVPAARMKMGEEHRVPLSAAAMRVVSAMRDLRQNDWVFPSIGRTASLSNMAMLAVLKRIGYGHVTVHGMRATFATWAEECTDFEEGVREAVLAHRYKNETVAAYQRGDKLAKRRVLMQEWAQFCESSAH